MAKQTNKEQKAVKKLDKAVSKAVNKGVSPSTIDDTVEMAIADRHEADVDQKDSSHSLNKRPMIADSKKVAKSKK